MIRFIILRARISAADSAERRRCFCGWMIAYPTSPKPLNPLRQSAASAANSGAGALGASATNHGLRTRASLGVECPESAIRFILPRARISAADSAERRRCSYGWMIACPTTPKPSNPLRQSAASAANSGAGALGASATNHGLRTGLVTGNSTECPSLRRSWSETGCRRRCSPCRSRYRW